MKKIYTLLFFILFLGISCHDRSNEETSPGDSTDREVEIKISESGPNNTRAPQADPGIEDERTITELDLIAFDCVTKEYLYIRKPFRYGNATYRVTVPVEPEKVDVLLIANAHPAVEEKAAAWIEGTTTLEEVMKSLTDIDPSRLIDRPDYLPMSGFLEEGTILRVGLTKWGPVDMLRSVASVDLTAEKTNKTENLKITALHLYYAPDRAYLPAFDGKDVVQKVAGITETQYAVPVAMTTTLNTLSTNDVSELVTGEGTANEKKYYSIRNKMYLYENDVEADKIGTSGYSKKFTRVILKGSYSTNGGTTSQDAFYPIDFVYSDSYTGKAGKFRPILRNWKYQFNITAVNGPGYPSIEEAAENYPVDLEYKIVDWNLSDVEIGVSGEYYVSIERKKAILARPANSEDRIGLSYRIYDLIPGNEFTVNFKNQNGINGYQRTEGNGIRNDWFYVELEHDAENSRSYLNVKARENYNPAHAHDTVIIKFRNLEFEIEIIQLDTNDEDWYDGGNIPSDL